MKLSENLESVFLSESGEITIREILDRSEHRGFAFLLVIFTLPIALPFTPPGFSTVFAVLVALLAVQMMAKRQQPWFPGWVMTRKVKTGDSRFVRAMHKWAAFFERFLRPRMAWLYSPFMFRILLGPVILLAAAAMSLPFPGTNSAPALAVSLIALGMLEEDGVCGLAGVLLALMGLALATWVVVMISIHGPEGLDMVKRSLGRG